MSFPGVGFSADAAAARSVGPTGRSIEKRPLAKPFCSVRGAQEESSKGKKPEVLASGFYLPASVSHEYF
jgi:hypothetical protein